ncbi:hypothetical protein CLPUN_42430 [Clostridium puniceum]|uniref:Phage protein Gp138 N-terminal domain-containing protein n=1 Tax=Clostridium puniceum TaxID=29367 RepID=A0A1S8T975_9CLOT|nr:Gp138 family membrane-puncturing spike protein [Clostridium puniceum]OOM74005.1 hypothetical protein CLPUN_42430 [Clostridium puniceum]
MSRNVSEIIGSEDEMYRGMGDNWKNVLRVACPGIIQNFDPHTQTVTVKPALRENVTKEDFSKEWMDVPLLLDVPIVIPRSGRYSLTMPIKTGDECLVIFLDSCMDAWFTHGGIQNQMEKRRHDLSDAIAIIGLYSQPNVISNYSTNSCQLRNNSGTSYIELKDNEINLHSDKIVLNGVIWDTHTHSGVHGETSGPH